MPSPSKPEAIAQRILDCAERPQRDAYVGTASKFGTVLGRYAPRLTDLLLETGAQRLQKRRRLGERRRWSASEPAAGGLPRARFVSQAADTRWYGKAASRPLAAGAAVAGVVLAAAWIYRYGLPRRPRTPPKQISKRAEKKLQKQARRIRRRLK